MIPRLDNNNYSPKYTEIEDTLKAACDNYRIPGMAVEVVDAEGVLFSGTYGDCKSLDTPFITGSLSKSFTAACIMKLYEGGYLNIDSPVNSYLDAAEVFKNPKDATKDYDKTAAQSHQRTWRVPACGKCKDCWQKWRIYICECKL